MPLSAVPVDDSPIDADEASRILGLSSRTLYDLADRGILPCIRYQGVRAVRFERGVIERYKNKCRTGGTVKSNAGAGVLTYAWQGSDSGLRNSFRKAGAKIKPRNTTESKRKGSLPKLVVSNP